MNNNEIRVVKISGSAIDELVWELLNKSGEQFLDLPENSETIFHLNWDILYDFGFGRADLLDPTDGSVWEVKRDRPRQIKRGRNNYINTSRMHGKRIRN